MEKSSKYFNQELETAPLEKIRATQLKKLNKTLEYIRKNNRFYQRKFLESGFEIEKLQSLEVLNKLPFSTKHEFQLDQTEFPPFGTNLSQPLSQFIRYHQTTGTTGKPLKWLDTLQSWQWRIDCASMPFLAAGVKSDDIVFVPFAFGPHVAFWTLFEAANQIGALTIAGGGWDTRQRLNCIIENQVSVVCSTPTYVLRMLETAQKEGIDLKNSTVHTIILGGEPGGLNPSLREKIVSAWKAEPFDYIGLTEVGGYGFQCQHQAHAIHINEAEFIIEVIDPETGRQLPDGKIGEMVLTNLGRNCSPAIRFRTGDLVKLISSTCLCSRTFRLLDGGILGRTDDMITIRGMNVFPAKIGEQVEGHLLVGDEYRMEAYDKNGMGEFKILIELSPPRSGRVLSQKIKDEIRQNFEIRVEVEIVAPETLPRFEYKSKRFIDRRKISKKAM